MAHTMTIPMTIPNRADFKEMADEAMQKEIKAFNFEITKLWNIYRKLQERVKILEDKK
jgi:hypothetical protein